MEWAPRGSCAQDIAEFAHARDTRHWTAYTGPIDWGTWTSRVRGCSLPLQGQWTTPPDRATRQSKPKLHIQRCTSGLNGGVDGEWVNSTFWVPSGCNASKPFTDFDHRDVVQCLTRRVLLFEGDSVVRQLFMRAIWYFRQLPIIIEHYSHRDMVYSIHEDSDSLHVLEPSQCMEATHRYRAMEARRLCLRRRRETSTRKQQK
ncbi:hypothetical protein AB1Y20_000988 [Prymnesium parvum]|uniref:Glycosyl transferase CAP10 domain-containing protein n=1 Tax=Prymnesium parvum TaxID=97485 RepID=A0AB34KAP9_PRYPA